MQFLDKNYRDTCRNNIIQLFPKEIEIFAYHPLTNNYLVSNFGNVKNSISGKSFSGDRNYITRLIKGEART